jgi:hypothetical protein
MRGMYSLDYWVLWFFLFLTSRMRTDLLITTKNQQTHSSCYSAQTAPHTCIQNRSNSI